MEPIQRVNISENNFEQCTKCTVCTVYCPVTAVNPLFPGPKQGGPDSERYRLKDPGYFNPDLKYCLNCKRCEVACPSNVKVGDIIQSARIKYTKTPPSLRDSMLADTDLMGTVATTIAPIVNTTLSLRPVKFAMDKILRIDSHRTFPSYASQRFSSWFRRHAAPAQQNYPRKAVYFHGCYVEYNYPKLGRDLVRLANAAGYGVALMEKERCCGVAKISNRLIKQATRDAVRNIEAVRDALATWPGAPVLGTSSTCIFTMRDEYPHLLHLDNADIRPHIMLATRWLFEKVESGEVKLAFRPGLHMRVAYHTPCHMSKLGWAYYSTSLLRMIPGLELTVLDSCCCGIAGTYGFKKENYKYSQEIGAPLFRQIGELAPDLVATDCETCKWQIEMSTSARVENPVSILADAIDFDATLRLNTSPRN